jgi:hypothetical protein
MDEREDFVDAQQVKTQTSGEDSVKLEAQYTGQMSDLRRSTEDRYHRVRQETRDKQAHAFSERLHALEKEVIAVREEAAELVEGERRAAGALVQGLAEALSKQLNMWTSPHE